MRPGIRARFLLLTIALVLVSSAVFDAYLASSLGDRLSEQTAHDLYVRASLTLERARVAAEAGSLAADAQAIASENARIAEARVTIIDPSGAVRGDSDVSGGAVLALENHAQRPEIIEARERGIGRSQRYSSTVRDRLLYVALRLDRPEGPWMVRLAFAPLAVDRMIAEVRRNLLFGTLMALGVATGLGIASASVFTRSIRHLIESAKKMQGDLSMRTRLRGGDEISKLGMALDELATELQRSISDLSHQRDQLEAMLEAMQEGVLVTGEDGSITAANRALRSMLLVGDVIGLQPIEALRNAELHELLALATRTRKPVSRELEFGSIRRRRVRVQVSPLSGAGDRPKDRDRARGLVAVFFDVTELRRLETLRRDFVANVSHELRTPIAAIRATSETLRAGALEEPDTAREFVEIIDRNSQRLHRLVEDLLDLSKIEAKEVDLRLELVDARASAAAAIDLLRTSAEQKETALTLDAGDAGDAGGAGDAGEPLEVRADGRALEQILTNLIDNAIKYCPPRASVAVRVYARDERVIFEIIDDGPGIDASHLPRLFERFYRVDTGRSRALGGTGLGLAIVKHLAEALGGQVTVESSLGRGSVFRVDLPSAAAGSAEGPSPRPRE